ncbi:MAG: alpha/beta hydrolase [Myxococcales bacterium]|nr:MAG: alpha/beta hydrolase [Myxococcales bacterium]
MERKSFEHDGLKFSYLDAGGDGELLVALHALWMEAGTFVPLAEALAPGWRVVALDQRGHGRSDHAASSTWGDYVSDLGALLDHLRATRPVVLLGNSLGGTAAFLFAARHPERVRALIAEEAPAKEDADLGFMLAWQGVFATREALLAKVGERLSWSVEPSIRQVAGGYTLAFSPRDLAERQAHLNGEYWHEWRATSCPALVVRGSESRAVDGAILERMAAVRPHTQLVTIQAGHVVHHDAPALFLAAVEDFLAALPR